MGNRRRTEEPLRHTQKRECVRWCECVKVFGVRGPCCSGSSNNDSKWRQVVVVVVFVAVKPNCFSSLLCYYLLSGLSHAKCPSNF